VGGTTWPRKEEGGSVALCPPPTEDRGSSGDGGLKCHDH
jgi:hypothetical protein